MAHCTSVPVRSFRQVNNDPNGGFFGSLTVTSGITVNEILEMAYRKEVAVASTYVEPT